MEHVIDGCQCKGKLCSMCKQTQCLDYFPSKKKARDGRYSYCRACGQKRKNEWVRNNRERDSSYKIAWAKANRDKATASAKKYSQNSEHVKQLRRKNAAKWNKAHPEAIRKHKRNNRDLYNSYGHAYRTKKTQAGGTYTLQEWEALKAQYDYQCLCCGKQEPDIKLTADHIIPVSKGGTSYIENIQPLCQPCNSSKCNKIIDYRPSAKKDIS